MNELKIFSNPKFGQVRTIDLNNKTYFVGSDVAKALGYAIPSKAINTHCKGVSKTEVPTSGGIQEMLIIPEGDVYRLAAKSELSGADKFESWIFDEVLPSIRKTGVYLSPLVDSKMMFQIAQALENKEKEVVSLTAKIAQDKPKVLFAEALEVSDCTILVGELAKLLRQNEISIGQNRLFWWLRHNSYLGEKGEYYNMPTQKSMELGLFEIKVRTVNNPDGSIRETRTPVVTGKGQQYFINKFLNKSA